ncbi:MAG: site-specific DNA-methyltransferase, partial [Desulfomonile sp.]|nr:site-specific DNA-methyltransferase [Desulfomonile sp.]
MQTRTFTCGTATIELHLGDCFAGMDRLGPETIDVVVTSPPYNLGIGYGVYDDSIDRAAYLEWLEQWAIRVKRVLSSEGSLFLNIAGKPSDPWGPIEAAFRLRSHLVLQNTIHWVKSIAVDQAENGNDFGEQAQINLGHIKPINSRRYLSDAHEYIFHFTKSGDVAL